MLLYILLAFFIVMLVICYVKLEKDIIRLAKEDVDSGFESEMKHELNTVLSDCGHAVKDLDAAYSLYFKTYCEYKSIKEDI